MNNITRTRRDRDDSALPDSSSLHGGSHACKQRAHWHAHAERLLGFGSWTWDPSHDRMTWSDGLFALLSYDKASPPNHHDFVAAFHPEDRPALLIRLQAALDSGTGFVLNARLAGEGTTLPVRVSAEALRPEKNRLRRIEGAVQREQTMLRDVHEFDEISAHHELLLSILDNIPVLIACFSDDGRARLINRAFEAATGFSGKDLPHLDLLTECFPEPAYRDEVWAYIQRAGAEWRDIRLRGRNGHHLQSAWSNVRLSDGTLMGIGVDLRERRVMEHRLRESETKFRAIYDSNAVPFLFWYVDGRVLEANDACLRLLGRTREELATGSIDWREAITPELYAHVELAMRETAATAIVIPPFETDIPKNGGRLPALVGGAMFTDRKMGVAFLLDLSERKRAEEALRREKEFTRAVIDNATDAIFAFDSECRYTLWNKVLERMTGKSAQEVIGRKVFETSPFLHEPSARDDACRALSGEICNRTGLRLNVPELGIDGYYDTYYSPLHGPKGEIIGGVGVLHEVTAQTRAEESLRLREQEFEAIAENSPDIVGRFDRMHRYVYLNRRVEAVTGRPRFYFMGKTNRELGLSEEQTDRWDVLLDRVFTSKQEQAAEFLLRDLNGAQRTFEWRLAPEEELNEVHTVLAIARDVTERKRIEEELREANRRLEATMTELRARQQQIIQAEKLSALGTLAAGIAHELNNPMMGVMNYVDYAERVASDSTVRQVLFRASRELERMRDLLRNMLAFTRPMDEPPTEFEVATVIDSALTLMSPELRARDIEVVTDFTPDLPKLKATESLLQQVFVNLLMNARDALESSPRKRMHIRALAQDGHVRVDFTDSGRGIPLDIQDKIFDPFFTTKPPGRGTGLGLSISRTIMLEMGGELFYRSDGEEGTTFSVVIPSASLEGDLKS